MGNSFFVGDEFRTNPLSLKPGGSTVTVHYEKKSARKYDKVKKPQKYIAALARLDDADEIVQIDVDDTTVWKRTSEQRNFY